MNNPRRKGECVIDLDYLIDQLEDLLTRSWRVPVINKALVDEEEYLRLIDQMRIAMPTEIKQARQIQHDRDQIVAQAKERAEHIIALAEEQARQLVSEHEVLKRAHQEREAIIQAAQKEAEQIRAQADAYALEVLMELDKKLTEFHQIVQNGIELLEAQQKARRAFLEGQGAPSETPAEEEEAHAVQEQQAEEPTGEQTE